MAHVISTHLGRRAPAVAADRDGDLGEAEPTLAVTSSWRSDDEIRTRDTTHCGRLRTTDIDEAELVERAAREPRAVVRGRDVADDGRGRDVAVVDERAQEDAAKRREKLLAQRRAKAAELGLKPNAQSSLAQSRLDRFEQTRQAEISRGEAERRRMRERDDRMRAAQEAARAKRAQLRRQAEEQRRASAEKRAAAAQEHLRNRPAPTPAPTPGPTPGPATCPTLAKLGRVYD